MSPTSKPAIRRTTPPARRCDLRPSRTNLLAVRRRLTSASPRLADLAPTVLPDEVDLALLNYIAPRDQGPRGSCAGHATAESRELIWAKANGMHLADRLSVAYAWARARMAEGNWPQDVGTTLADEFGVLEGFGIPPEQDMPYVADAAQPIPAIADAAARDFRITDPCTVDMGDADGARRVLAAGLPIAIGIPVYESFEGGGTNGLLAMPDTNSEALLGGHALCVVGYDVARRAWRVLNSWGTSWSDGGFCWMPWGYPLWEAWTAPD